MQKYLDEAEKDRERYTKEMEQYQQTEAYKLFTKKKHEKKTKGTGACFLSTLKIEGQAGHLMERTFIKPRNAKRVHLNRM